MVPPKWKVKLKNSVIHKDIPEFHVREVVFPDGYGTFVVLKGLSKPLLGSGILASVDSPGDQSDFWDSVEDVEEYHISPHDLEWAKKMRVDGLHLVK